MGKHWIYVLKNDNGFNDNKSFYVGETIRLYTRLNEHLQSKGGKSTFNFYNVKLVGLYRMVNNALFTLYNDKLVHFLSKENS